MNSNNTGTATAALVVGIVAFVCSWVFSSWGWLGTNPRHRGHRFWLPTRSKSAPPGATVTAWPSRDLC